MIKENGDDIYTYKKCNAIAGFHCHAIKNKNQNRLIDKV